jgi:hypothetical protein
MQEDRRKYKLESLEQRLLLSGTGILDELAAGAPAAEALVQVQGYEVDEQVTISNQSNSAYYPEAQLSDLFVNTETGVEPEADPGEGEGENPLGDPVFITDDRIEKTLEPAEAVPVADSEFYGGTGREESESLPFSLDQNKTAEQSSSDQLLTATAVAQSSTADELVTTLNAAQPPPPGSGDELFETDEPVSLARGGGPAPPPPPVSVVCNAYPIPYHLVPHLPHLPHLHGLRPRRRKSPLDVPGLLRSRHLGYVE